MPDHLPFETTGADWQLRVERGTRPLPRRMAVTLVNAPGQPEHLAVPDDRELGRELDEALFRFTPPPEWRRIEVVREDPAAGSR